MPIWKKINIGTYEIIHVPFIIVIAILVLTACSQQTTPAPTMVVLQTETQTTMTSNPTQAPTEIENPTQKPTETNTIEQSTASEAVPTIFTIIPGILRGWRDIFQRK